MISRPPGRFKAIYMFYDLGMRQLSILCSNVSKKVSTSFPFTLLDFWLNEATISASGLLVANPLILSTTRLREVQITPANDSPVKDLDKVVVIEQSTREELSGQRMFSNRSGSNKKTK
jgi:hypothetical protein